MVETVDCNPPRLYLVPRWGWLHWNMAKTFGTRKRETLYYRVALFWWRYI